MTERFSAGPVLEGLMGFQRDTVEHVFSALHSEGGSGRFLVADETGLGKSIVARGLVAKTIEHLQDADPEEVSRIDIVYVCSNMDLARQNIGRLNVTSEEEIAFSSRLSLLGKHSRKLNSTEGRSRVNGKLVNLISFTPSTSFDPGFAFGTADERALLLLALEDILELDADQIDWGTRMLKGSVGSDDNMRGYVSRTRAELADGIDPVIRHALATIAGTSTNGFAPSLEDFMGVLDDAMSAGDVTRDIQDRIWPVVGRLRRDLARAGITTLQPDLIILDEFQRFRSLLDPSIDAGELAGALFSEGSAKVLLLSATPYKPFTYAEEEEDHAQDFLNTIRFLNDEKAGDTPQTDAVESALTAYRQDVTSGRDGHASAEEASRLLLRVMSRNERPQIQERSMLEESVVEADDLRADDLAGYIRLNRLGNQLDARSRLVSVDYWKSAPYFLTFCGGYKLYDQLKQRETNVDPPLRAAVRSARHITKQQVEGRQAIDLGNARLRMLADEVLGSGAWRMLWMPPSLPYLRPDGPFADHDLARLTKRLVFSAWAATPAAVASLLSYEVNRRMLEADGGSAESIRGQLLSYRPKTESGHPPSMTTLMLFWPMPGLAAAIDPRGHARTGELADSAALVAAAAPAIERTFSGSARGDAHDEEDARRVWQAAFAHESTWPTRTSDSTMVHAMSPSKKGATLEHQRDELNESRMSELLREHIEHARQLSDPPRLSDEDLTVLAELGAFSPANISWRVLNRLKRTDDEVSDDGLMVAAAALAGGLRTLFNTPHATTLVRLAHQAIVDASRSSGGEASGRQVPYWRQVLEYSAHGNLEAVLEEWLFNRRNESALPWTDESVLAFARDEAAAISLRTSTLTAFDASAYGTGDTTIRFPMQFAVRYGARDAQGGDDARMPEVRASFNSPFWPFVLVSTSVGQEGIDFHWWCHALLHWNVPPNPVDFEQREGRIDRFRGHAIRKNIAANHGAEALGSDSSSPWSELYELATDLREEHGHFTPDWVYPGPSKIQRHVLPFALSRDTDRYRQVTKDVSLYRLALGQPRQEDMIRLLRDRDEGAGPPARINLKPPPSNR